MGEFLGNKKETFKVGFASQVQFKVNAESYAFLGLEAVANNAEYTPLTDSVKFEEAEKDEKNGIYKYNVTILKDTKELLIRPTCLAFPEVVSYSPDNMMEQYANTPIEITFSMPMEDPETTADQSLFKYPNVSLIYTDSAREDHDMSEYFEDPVFDVQKKTLIIYPKAVELSDYLHFRSPADITVSFTPQIVVTKEGVELPLKQNDKASFKIRYTYRMSDTVPPQKVDFFATHKEDVSMSNVADVSEQDKFAIITKEALAVKQPNNNILLSEDSEFTSIIKQNRTKGYLSIYGKYSDAESNISKVIIIQEEFESKIYTKESPDITFISDGQGNTEFFITYTLQKYYHENGNEYINTVHNIEIAVEDSCGNRSDAEKFCFVNTVYYELDSIDKSSNNYETLNNLPHDKYSAYYRISNIPKDMFIDMKNSTTMNNKTQQELNEFIQSYSNEVKHNQLKLYYDNLFLGVYPGVFIQDPSIKIYCTYTDKNGKEHIMEEFDNHVDTERYWSFDFNVDSLFDTSFIVTVEDYFGVQGQTEVIPIEKPIFSQQWINKDSNENVSGYIYYSFPHYAYNSISMNSYLIVKTMDTQQLKWKEPCEAGRGDSFLISTNEMPVGSLVSSGELIFNDFTEIKKPTGTLADKISYAIRKDENKRINIDFTFAQDIWNNFDQILLTAAEYALDGFRDIRIAKNQLSYTYNQTENNYYFDKEVPFIFRGASNSYALGLGEEEITIKIGPLDPVEYDEDPPVLSIEQIATTSFNGSDGFTDNYSYNFILKDTESGISSDGNKLKIGNNEYSFTEQNGYTVTLPSSKIFGDITTISSGSQSISSFTFNYTAYDNNNNKVEETLTFKSSLPRSDYLYDVADTKFSYASNTLTITSPVQTKTFNIYTTPASGTNWVIYSGSPVSAKPALSTIGTVNTTINDSIFANKWIRIVGQEFNFTEIDITVFPNTSLNQKWRGPQVYYGYTGPKPAAGQAYLYTMVQNSDDSVLLNSNASLYVHTVKTNLPYEQIKNWTYYEWLQYGQEVHGSVLNYAASYTAANFNMCYYRIDPAAYDQIKRNEYYVIIAHYGDDKITTLMSEIMQK